MEAHYNERVLRVLCVMGEVSADLTFMPPLVYEMVAFNKQEHIRSYYLDDPNHPEFSTPHFDDDFSNFSSYHRFAVLARWRLLTGERLTYSLEPMGVS